VNFLYLFLYRLVCSTVFSFCCVNEFYLNRHYYHSDVYPTGKADVRFTFPVESAEVCKNICMYIYIFTYMYTYICIFTFPVESGEVCKYVCLYMYIYTYIYVYIYLYIFRRKNFAWILLGSLNSCPLFIMEVMMMTVYRYTHISVLYGCSYIGIYIS
jgi:hypothetical protein